MYQVTIFRMIIHSTHCIRYTIVVFTAFIIPQRRNQLPRNVSVIAIRFGLLAALAWYAPAAFIGYLIAYMLMILVLQFVDGLEHDYPYRTNLYMTRSPSTKEILNGSKNTFSPILSSGMSGSTG